MHLESTVGPIFPFPHPSDTSFLTSERYKQLVKDNELPELAKELNKMSCGLSVRFFCVDDKPKDECSDVKSKVVPTCTLRKSATPNNNN